MFCLVVESKQKKNKPSQQLFPTDKTIVKTLLLGFKNTPSLLLTSTESISSLIHQQVSKSKRRNTNGFAPQSPTCFHLALSWPPSIDSLLPVGHLVQKSIRLYEYCITAMVTSIRFYRKADSPSGQSQASFIAYWVRETARLAKSCSKQSIPVSKCP